MNPNQPSVPQGPEAPQAPLLQGQRQTGEVPLANGYTAVHEVTGDGMKQTRIVGPPRAQGYRSGLEWMVRTGQGTPEDIAAYERNEAAAAKASQGQRAGSFITRWFHRK